MEGNQNISQSAEQPVLNSAPEPGTSDRKRIFVVAGAAIFTIMIVAILLFSSSDSRESLSQGTKQESQNPTNEGNLPSSTKAPSSQIQASPEEVAKNFYTWYVNHPSPIESGEYEKRQDIATEFKEVMGRFVKKGINPGYDHVFCEDIILPKNAVPQEPIYDDDSQSMALVTFKDVSGGRDLFQIKLESVQGNWLISDVRCALSE